MHQTELTPPPLPRAPTKTFVQVYLLQESDSQLGASKKNSVIETFQDITNKSRCYMKSQTPETQCAEGIFKQNTLIMLLNLQIIYQGHAEHNTDYENF